MLNKKIFIAAGFASSFWIGIAYAYGSVLDNQFFSCRVANSNGVMNISTLPYYVPDGWEHSSDRDGDGVSCEPEFADPVFEDEVYYKDEQQREAEAEQLREDERREQQREDEYYEQMREDDNYR